MGALYDQSHYYVDFSNRSDLSLDDQVMLENIQQQYRPIERAEFLIPFRLESKITADEFETMTGIPYSN